MQSILNTGTRLLEGTTSGEIKAVKQCVYELIVESQDICEDVSAYCQDIPESINLFRLRYCALDNGVIFYTFLVRSKSTDNFIDDCNWCVILSAFTNS